MQTLSNTGNPNDQPTEVLLDPELSLYRRYTIALLRRYFRMSIELGRLPSIVGREFFRSKVTSYRMHSFEDVVILVHDVEKCLAQIDDFSQQLIARVVLEDHSHDEAAVVIGCTRRTVIRRMPEALDKLSDVLLRAGLLRRLASPPSHQEDAVPESPASALANVVSRDAETTDSGEVLPTSPCTVEKVAPESCQEGEEGEFAASA